MKKPWAMAFKVGPAGNPWTMAFKEGPAGNPWTMAVKEGPAGNEDPTMHTTELSAPQGPFLNHEWKAMAH